MTEVRLIDANALKKEFMKDFYNAIGNGNSAFDVIGAMKKAIDNAPTVEPNKDYGAIQYSIGYNDGFMSAKELITKEPERPQGEWKLIRVADHCGIHDSFVCPFCNYEREYRKKNFCEECGADMRGEKNG